MNDPLTTKPERAKKAVTHDWTDGEDAQLAQMWNNERLSESAIARRMGLTKGQVSTRLFKHPELFKRKKKQSTTPAQKLHHPREVVVLSDPSFIANDTAIIKRTLLTPAVKPDAPAWFEEQHMRTVDELLGKKPERQPNTARRKTHHEVNWDL
jgi:hypothetical protein